MQLATHSEMIHIETEHFSLNRTLLIAIGLWPYQRSRLAPLQLIFISAVLISFVVFQLTTFITAECTSELIVKIFCSVIFFLMFIVEYNCFWANGETVKYLMEQLQRICNELRDKNEVAIIRKYGGEAKFYTVALTWSLAVSILVLISVPIWPRILDIVLSMNGSWARRTTQIVTEYFVDPDRYFYFILLHMDASCCLGTIVVLATGTTFITYMKHICGMFRVASYRIEQALSRDVLRKISLKNEITIHKGIVYAVEIHRNAMKYSEFLISSFEGLFMFLIFFGVICLSLNLFRIFQIVSFGGNTEEFLLHFIYIIDILIYMLLANYFGQEVIDHNQHMFITVYNVQWYLAPLHTQKMILFILQRGNKIFHLSIGGIIAASLESFSTLFSTSISYFTVMYSTQQ